MTTFEAIRGGKYSEKDDPSVYRLPAAAQFLSNGTWQTMQLRYMDDHGVLVFYDDPLNAHLKPGDHGLLAAKLSPQSTTVQVWCQVRLVDPIRRLDDGTDIGVAGLTFLPSDPMTFRLRANLRAHAQLLTLRLGSAKPLNFEGKEVSHFQTAMEILRQEEVATLLVLADGNQQLTATQWRTLKWTYPARFTNLIVFSPTNGDDDAYFIGPQRLEPNMLEQLIQASLQDYARHMTARLDGGLSLMLRSEYLSRVQAAASRLSIQREFRDTLDFAAKSMIDLNKGKAAICLMNNPYDGSLVGSGVTVPTGRGVLGCVLATGTLTNLDRLATHRAFDPTSDHVLGDADDRVLLAPFRDIQGNAGILAVSRSRKDPPFGSQEEQICSLICDLFAAPLIAQNLKTSFEMMCQQQRNKNAHLFNEEALATRHLNPLSEGDILPFSPFWERWAFASVAVIFTIALLFAAIGRVSQYATGPALIQANQETRVTALRSGIVKGIQVPSGAEVQAGQILFTITTQDQEDRKQALDAGWNTHLVQRLLDPSDPTSEQALRQLRIERDALFQAIERNAIRAPHDGVTSDLRIHDGQWFQSGEIALTLTKPNPTFSLIGCVPGHFAPQLSEGMTVRFRVNGYEHDLQLKVDRTSQGVISPAEATRIMGPQAQDMLGMNAPVTLVYAQVENPRIELDNQSFSLVNGMTGEVQIKLRSESILMSLIPALKSVVGGSHER